MVATIFAPTDDAFTAALEKLDMTKEEVMANKELLGEILKYHIVPGAGMKSDVLTDGEMLETALDGEELEVSMDGESVMIMPADADDDSGAVTVVEPDILTCHTVIHKIDGVLLPPDFDPADFADAEGADAEAEAE